MTLSASSSRRLLTWWRYSGTWEKISELHYNFIKICHSVAPSNQLANTACYRSNKHYAKLILEIWLCCALYWFCLVRIHILLVRKKKNKKFHLSLLHQPLSFCSIQAIRLLQEALLKRVLVNLRRWEQEQSEPPHFCSQAPQELTSNTNTKLLSTQQWQNKCAKEKRLATFGDDFPIFLAFASKEECKYESVHACSPSCSSPAQRASEVSTCRSESMLRRLRSRLRSTASPLRSLSIRSRMPEMVLLCTFISLIMWKRKSSKPMSLQATATTTKVSQHQSGIQRAQESFTTRLTPLGERKKKKVSQLYKTCDYVKNVKNINTYQIDGSMEFCKTYVRSKNKNILLIMICWKKRHMHGQAWE